ncbi:protein chromatin remodeling 20 [Podospora aff. communis PSN243]|uniref:Protein chromatin remodeling 20 n=1 Tax=Podospora aff. communis PSN243 TaxID=3040156 RepID=A0AAV9H9D4_9PEZI|nr:protein chromatin remodeling 20 [Podospora aff. communis PSN243]
MAEAEETDPYLWDMDRVVRELCTTHRSWQPQPRLESPNLANLEASIRDKGIDGQTLLIYAIVFGKQSLVDELGVRKLSHRLWINDAITQFQKRSPGFRKWKREQEENNSDEDETCPVPSRKGPAPEPLLNGTAVSQDSQRHDAGGQLAPISSPRSATPSILPTLAAPKGLKRDLKSCASTDDHVAQQSVPDGPPTKKRRVQLTLVSSTPIHPNGTAPPTEGDWLHIRRTEDNLMQMARPSPAYLGDAASRFGRLATDTPVDDESTEISWVGRPQHVPGRRIQAARVMKRVLLSESSHVPKAESADDEDEVLPVFGESDDEQSIDSETWNAYQRDEERKERRKTAKQAAKESQLEPDKVAEGLERAIQREEASWASTKKGECDRKARKLWDNARRNPNRQRMIAQLKADRQMLDARLEKLKEEFLKEEWENEIELDELVQAHMGVTIHELQRTKWRIKVIESPHPPPRAKSHSNPRSQRHRTPENSSDEESIPSDVDESDSIAGSDNADDLLIENHPTFDLMEVNMSETEEPGRPRVQSPEERPVLEMDSQSSPCRSRSGSPSTVPTMKNEVNLPETPRRILHQPSNSVIEIQSSPVINGTKEKPPLEDVDRIAQIGIEHWAAVKDYQRLVVAVLAGLSTESRASVLGATQSSTSIELWDRFIQPLVDAFDPTARSEDCDATSTPIIFMRLFDCFISGGLSRLQDDKVQRLTLQRLVVKRAEYFERFCRFLSKVSAYFVDVATPTPTRIKLISRRGTESQEPLSQPANLDIEDVPDEVFSSESSEEDTLLSSTKKRKQKRKPARDKMAEKLRLTTVIQKEENEKKRLLFRASGAVAIPTEKSRLIVNETKDADQALIYINKHIGDRIKDHQIEGVRFLWDHIVHSGTNQGCLLAHEMGLGKTMQAITLLVVISEATKSDDPSIRSQIPKHLQTLKTLILCPSGLVDNWNEEISIWGNGMLGQVRKLDALLPVNERIKMVKEWDEEGGILLIGYKIFTSMVWDDNLGLRHTLETAPSIVVADEAHQLKNPSSQRHQACSNFKTMSRIALTGSPLTTNVMNYYAMINWVAPNYLADIQEFKRRFEEPIKEGLYADSSDAAKRKARKMLHILKETVGPKVHRKDVQVLRDTLPGKKEFIITVPLTDVQKRAYKAYLDVVRSRAFSDGAIGFTHAKTWSLVSVLSRLLAHPRVFKQAVEDRKKKSHNPRKGKKTKDANLDSTADDNEFLNELPIEYLSNISASMSDLKDIDNPCHSYRMQVLFAILDECKRVRDKVLVFSHSLVTLDYLENAFKRQKRNYSRLDGQTKISDRQKAIKSFNNDPEAEIYLISTTAGGVGLNIYGANRVVIFDFKYTPAEEQQAIGRAYRIGQTKTVFVYWLTTGGTFEAAIHNNAVFKKQLASRVVDKKNPDPYANKVKEYFVDPTIPDQEDLTQVLDKDGVLDAVLRLEKLRDVVRKVITTETFEKEEVYELSAEDKLEAEADIEMERLRINNPEEYRRQEALKMNALMGPALPFTAQPTALRIPQPNFGQPTLIGRPPSGQNGGGAPSTAPPTAAPANQTAATPATPPRPIGPPSSSFSTVIPSAELPNGRPLAIDPSTARGPPLTAQDAPPTAQAVPPQAPIALTSNPEVFGELSVLSPDQAVAKQTTAGRPPFFGSILHGHRNNALDGSPTINHKKDDLEPILGSGTLFKDTPVALSPSPSNSNKDHAAQLSTVLSRARDKLREAERITAVPSDLVSSFLSELDKSGCIGLPRLDKLQVMIKCAKQDRFAEALLAGYLKPGELAKIERTDLFKEASRLSNMEEPAFNAMVWEHAATEPRFKREPRRPPSRNPSTPNVPGHGRTGSARLGPSTAMGPSTQQNGGPGELVGLQQHIAKRDAGKRKPKKRPGDSAESPLEID